MISCAYDANGPGKSLSDRFKLLDVKDTDSVIAFAKGEGVSLVYSVSSDIAATAAVHVSSLLGLPHFFSNDLMELFNSKPALRRHLNEHGIGPVEFLSTQSVDEVSAWSRYPCIVKPADAQGQRGVVKVHKKADLRVALRNAIEQSRSRTAIIEEFLQGVEISCNVLVCKGKTVVKEFSERLVHSGAFFGIPKGHLIPMINVSDRQARAADQLVHDLVKSLNIDNGTLYFQMIVTPDGPKIVEIAPRLDGCHLWRLMSLARGIDFLDLSVRCLLGETIEPVDIEADAGNVYELMFQQLQTGQSFHPDDFPVPADALYHEYRYSDGEAVSSINGHLEVVGYYVRVQ